MIMAHDERGRRAALAKLLPMQRQDFVELFRIMAGQPVTIRLLDPPLHEFLPHSDAELSELAQEVGQRLDDDAPARFGARRANPMLGHRGCRLGVTFPEIYEMQARAIFEGGHRGQEAGKAVVPEIMIPLVGTGRNWRSGARRWTRSRREVFAETGTKLE